MERIDQRSLVNELSELFAEIVVAEESRLKVKVFSKETQLRYRQCIKGMKTGLLTEEVKLLPTNLPALPKHYESIIAILGILVPFLMTFIFYWAQTDLFYAGLVSVSAIPILWILYYVSSGETLRRQSNVVYLLSTIMEQLKKSNRP